MPTGIPISAEISAAAATAGSSAQPWPTSSITV